MLGRMIRGLSGLPLGPAHRGQERVRDLDYVSAGPMSGRRGYGPEKMRMVSMPERRCACCSAVAGGFGVVGRDGIGVTDRERTVLSLISFGSGGVYER